MVVEGRPPCPWANRSTMRPHSPSLLSAVHDENVRVTALLLVGEAKSTPFPPPGPHRHANSLPLSSEGIVSRRTVVDGGIPDDLRGQTGWMGNVWSISQARPKKDLS